MFWTLLSALALAGWLALIFGRGDYWRASERLGPAPAPARWPEVVAIIPARNEAETIGAVIASHEATDYPGAFSIAVVNDASTDDTTARAKSATTGNRRVEILDAPLLAFGWSGKLWAMHHGVKRAREIASGAKYLLFTDADIVHAPSTLRRLVAKSEAENLALASLMARLDARGLWGGLLIPAFVYFFQQLYPFPLSNDPRRRVTAAAGGCMLVRRDALEDAGGVAAIADHLIDDCALARLIKAPASAAPRRIWTGLADDEVVSLRDNRRLSSIWSMVERSAFTQLNHSWIVLAGAIVGMGIIYFGPLATLLVLPWHQNAAAGALAAAAFALMVVSYWPTCRQYRQAPWRTALLPAASALYMAMTISSAVGHLRGAGGRWKGRRYP